jgi:hypothetical protein
MQELKIGQAWRRVRARGQALHGQARSSSGNATVRTVRLCGNEVFERQRFQGLMWAHCRATEHFGDFTGAVLDVKGVDQVLFAEPVLLSVRRYAVHPNATGRPMG